MEWDERREEKDTTASGEKGWSAKLEDATRGTTDPVSIAASLEGVAIGVITIEDIVDGSGSTAMTGMVVVTGEE